MVGRDSLLQCEYGFIFVKNFKQYGMVSSLTNYVYSLGLAQPLFQRLETASLAKSTHQHVQIWHLLHHIY